MAARLMQKVKTNYEESFFSSSTILCDAATRAVITSESSKIVVQKSAKAKR